jgi:hypothetical protein
VAEDLTWKVRREAGHESRQKAPAVVCFYWKRDGELVRFAEFTQLELEAEIERLNAAGKDVTQYVLALKRLVDFLGS